MKIKTLFLTSVFSACAFAQVSPATPVFARDYVFPPVGLASSETAQVNVVNVATPTYAARPAAASCTGTITFANATGTTVGSPVTFTTTGSAVFTTQLSFSALGVAGTRGEFVADIKVTSLVPSTAGCSLLFSLETFDQSTGATHVWLANSAAAPAILGPIPFPLPRL